MSMSEILYLKILSCVFMGGFGLRLFMPTDLEALLETRVILSFGLNVSVVADTKLESARSFSVSFPLLSCLI